MKLYVALTVNSSS